MAFDEKMKRLMKSENYWSILEDLNAYIFYKQNLAMFWITLIYRLRKDNIYKNTLLTLVYALVNNEQNVYSI